MFFFSKSEPIPANRLPTTCHYKLDNQVIVWYKSLFYFFTATPWARIAAKQSLEFSNLELDGFCVYESFRILERTESHVQLLIMSLFNLTTFVSNEVEFCFCLRWFYLFVIVYSVYFASDWPQDVTFVVSGFLDSIFRCCTLSNNGDNEKRKERPFMGQSCWNRKIERKLNLSM